MICTYEILSLEKISAIIGNGKSDRLGRLRLEADSVLDIKEPTYGAIPEDFQNTPTAQDRCTQQQIKIPGPEIYLIKDCMVWSKYGLIFIDRFLVRESFFHFPRHLMKEASFEGAQYHETSITLNIDDEHFRPREIRGISISTLAGIQANYYHWMMFVLPTLHPAIVSRAEGRGNEITALIYSGLNSYQDKTINSLLKSQSLASTPVGDKEFISSELLIFPQLFKMGGLTPHPVIKLPLQTLREQLMPREIPPSKLYVSRKDSSNRRLENEQEVEELLKSHGFTVVSLTGMPVEEQIALFRSATHIISPHGAGLTNLVFCKPGTKVLEIHAEGYVNWCYRRICALFELQYGFLYGKSVMDEKRASPHALKFSLSLTSLEEILANQNFA